MPWFEARDIRKVFELGDGTGEVTVALDDFSLSAERGDFVAIVGRSGSGKTTFLRIVAGLLERTSGALLFDEREKRGTAKIGMVFQEPRLMPWLTVERNILFSALNGPKKNIPYDKATHLLALLGLEKYRHAYPAQLSGGMAQRVALGRALCYEPELILMDEPLGSLDYFTRRSLQEEILKLYFAERKTIFLVTHDVSEALSMSRRVVVLDRGRMIGDVAVDLPYPRKQTDRRFAELLEKILSLITGEGQ